MNELLFTVGLLIIVGCNLGLLRLFYVMQQDSYETRRMMFELRKFIHDKHVRTNRLIGYVKQSEDDDEKDDQAEKRRERVKA